MTEQLDLLGWTPEQERKFAEYDAAHPEIWRAFCRFANEAIEAGLTQCSADMIFHRLRWQTWVGERNAEFRLNNNLTSFYARKWLKLHPQRAGFFKLRRSRADKEPGLTPAERTPSTTAQPATETSYG